MLRERVAAGGTVIMTTHILEVAERMADRIGVIADGRLIAEGTLDELRRQRATRRRAWKTRSSRWSPSSKPREPARHASPGSPSHELRLAWRDWLSMMTAGPPRGRVRDRRHRADRVFASSCICSPIVHRSPRYADVGTQPDKPTLVVVTGMLLLSWSLMMSQAMESVTRAFYARSDLDLILSSPVAAEGVRGAHRHHAARRR